MHSFGRYLLVFNHSLAWSQVPVVPPGEGVMAGLAAELQAAQLYSEEARTAVALRRSMQDMEQRWQQPWHLHSLTPTVFQTQQ